MILRAGLNDIGGIGGRDRDEDKDDKVVVFEIGMRDVGIEIVEFKDVDRPMIPDVVVDKFDEMIG